MLLGSLASWYLSVAPVLARSKRVLMYDMPGHGLSERTRDGYVPAAGIGWLVAGGLACTLGVVFFMTDSKVRFGHAVWHLFVLAGTACHFVAVLDYAM